MGRCREVLGRRLRLLAGGIVLAVSAALQAQLPSERIVFGGDANYPPFEWLDDDGRARGFYIDLARAVAGSGGLVSEHRLGDWPDAVRALESGQVDVLAMFESDRRAERFLFSPPFHFVNHGIYAPRDASDVSSLAELSGRVAIEELSYAHDRLRSGNFGFDLVLTDSTSAALDAVESGRADFAVLSAPSARYLIDRGQRGLRGIGPPIWPTGYVFAVVRDRPDLAQWIERQLSNVLRSGEFHEIVARWEPRLGAQSMPPAGGRVVAAAIVAASLLLAGFWLRGVPWRRRENRHDRESAEPAGAVQERRIDWARDHDVYTELPRLHLFLERVDALLQQAVKEGGRPQQMLAINPVDLERTIRTHGHRAGIAAVQDLARRLLSLGFPAYGQSGRDVYFVFGDKADIDVWLRGVVSPNDTLVMNTDPGPMLLVGSACVPDDGHDSGELLRRAETALAAAIARRESWVEYRPSMEPDAADLELLRVFRERAAEGLYPVFQAQVDVVTGAIVAAEALARWDAPGIGPVPPQKFIPLLEEAGLIRHVTSRMISETVRVSAELRQRGCPCPISVNVAVSDLLGDKTRQNIFKALRRHGGRPGDLKLELTETSVAESAETVRWVMTRLRESGIRVSIDDFGTGYSSLAYLSDFPIHEIKIDQSFISGIADKPQNRSIVRSTIDMAHALGLVVVAEGVDSDAALQVLRDERCDLAQGFLFSEPLPEQAFVALVESGAGRLPAAGGLEGQGSGS